jgi:hypothetical protein
MISGNVFSAAKKTILIFCRLVIWQITIHYVLNVRITFFMISPIRNITDCHTMSVQEIFIKKN